MTKYERKYIYWRSDWEPNDKGEKFANVHILAGYDSSFALIQKVITELRKTFPQASDENVIVGKITNSRHFKHFTVISFSAHIPDNCYHGWVQTSDKADYDWI